MKKLRRRDLKVLIELYRKENIELGEQVKRQRKTITYHNASLVECQRQKDELEAQNRQLRTNFQNNMPMWHTPDMTPTCGGTE